MGKSLESVTSSLAALSDRYRMITHNLANSSTHAFKRRVGTFAQVMDAQSKPRAEVIDSSEIDFSQGGMERTGRPLDLALDGEGFFTLETPDGPLYTRSGAFTVNQMGQLVDSAGRMVAGESGPITIPANVPQEHVQVSAQGEVFAAGAALGRLKIVTFAQAESLKQVGQGLYEAPPAARQDSFTGRVQQGSRELSNVSVVQELVDLITVSRLYEANFKAIGQHDERLKQVLGVAMA